MKIKTSHSIFAAGLMAAVLSSPIKAGQDQTMFELGAAQKKQTSKDFKPAPEEIKTNFGTLKFTGGGYPTTETAQKVYDELDLQSIGRINTLFSFFHQEKKDINDVRKERY